jgi:type IV pilus assembly protein PilE
MPRTHTNILKRDALRAPQLAHRPAEQLGFTLLELTIALACTAILSSLAWPNYQALLQRNQRAQARTALLQAAHWLERAASANGNYPAPAEVPTSVLQIEGVNYKLSLSSTAQTYTLSATPFGQQSADACGILTLSHLGARGVQNANTTAAQCWGR